MMHVDSVKKNIEYSKKKFLSVLSSLLATLEVKSINARSILKHYY